MSEFNGLSFKETLFHSSDNNSNLLKIVLNFCFQFPPILLALLSSKKFNNYTKIWCNSFFNEMGCFYDENKYQFEYFDTFNIQDDDGSWIWITGKTKSPYLLDDSQTFGQFYTYVQQFHMEIL